MFQAIRAIFTKDMKTTMRNPALLILSIIVPVVFVFLYSLITQLSATNPVVIARDSKGPASDKLLYILKNMESVDGKYFVIKTEDPKSAFEQYDNGKAAALIHIPPHFDQEILKGTAPEVRLLVHNLNSDGTKNFQLRLSHALYLFQNELNTGRQIKIVEEYSKFPRDVTMKLYISIGLLMFSVVYSSMVNTGILIVREWEERTGKEISLTSVGFSPFILGKWITALILTCISTILVLLVMSFTLKFPIWEMKPVIGLWIFLLFLFGASLGAIVGVYLRKSMPLITTSAVTGIFLYLICGNESSIRGFAYGGLIEVLWRSSQYIPISYIAENMRSTFLDAQAAYTYNGLFSALGLIALFSTLAVHRLKRNLHYTQGQ